MMKRVGLSAVVAVIALGVSAPAALADDTQCVGTLTGTFDNVVVPPNAACDLLNSIVKGNVTALQGSALFSSNNQIGGDLEGVRPSRIGSFGDNIGGDFAVSGAVGPGFFIPPFITTVFICATHLPGGNISVEKGSNGAIGVGAPAFGCPGNNVDRGNIVVQENFIPASQAMAVQANTVSGSIIGGNTFGGNLQVFRNLGQGTKFVQGNTVREDLQCEGNEQPFFGGPNIAGQAEGQCF